MCSMGEDLYEGKVVMTKYCETCDYLLDDRGHCGECLMEDNNYKLCGRCQKQLPLSSFAKNRAKTDGLQERCRECRSDHYKESNYLTTARDNTLKRKYGIGQADYECMLEEQNNSCAICQSGGPLVVDHCHTTGTVRGLLCSSCNLGLGIFKDNVSTLKSAMEYLKYDR